MRELNAADLDYILHRGTGINIYMFHGGTSFGFMSGASGGKTGLLPDVTSYDYDAPLDEAGHPTPKFYAYRKVLATFSPCGNESCLPPVPTAPPVTTFASATLSDTASLWANLPVPIPSEQPKSMEQFGQNYGYILYRTQLPAAVIGNLIIDSVHDYAQVYLDGRLAGTLDRRFNQSSLPLTTRGSAQLDILVANDGRINSTKQMRGEFKGITRAVTLAGQPLTGWQIYSLPMTTLPTHFTAKSQTGPAFQRGNFTLTKLGDVFLDIHQLGKGAVWINGHPIGRFWNVGPQQTLFVPAPWLHMGKNEIVTFDLMPPSTSRAAGLDHPILDGPVVDQTTQSQQ